LGIIRLAIIPAALGPVLYGNYSFLFSVFTQISQFLGFRTDEAFFNYNSRKRIDHNIVTWYIRFLLVNFFLLILFLILIKAIGLTNTIFPGQNFSNILLAAIFAYWFLKSNSIGIGFGDSKKLTVTVQKIFISLNVFMTATLLILFYLNFLSLPVLFVSQIAFSFLQIFILTKYYRNKGYINDLFYFKENFQNKSVKFYNKYFISYSGPLVISSFIVLVYIFFDRWYLQLVSGSIEQGYLNISIRFGDMIILFTGAMIPLFFKEIAKAHEDKNYTYLKYLYKKYSRLFFFISSFISVFVIFKIDFIITSIVGREYLNAVVPASVYLMYPIHQSIGQLNGAFLLATEKTRVVRNLSILVSIIGMFFSYILLSNQKIIFFYGFNLGALGVATKMVSVQIISVVIQTWIIAKYLRIKKIPLFIHQIIVLAIIASFIGILYFFEKMMVANNILSNQTILFLVLGISYLLMVVIIIYLFPSLIGFKKNELKSSLINKKFFQTLRKL